MSPSELDLRFASIRELAVSAGRLTLKHFQQRELEVEKKEDQSPVTVADKEAEQWLRKEILQQFPNDAVLGEEFGETPGTSGFRWILDPIDGTKSFISGVPLYGTMVGVEADGVAEMGAVYIPGLDEGLYAARGQGSWHFQGDKAPSRAQTSSRNSLDNAIFVTSEVRTFDRRQARDAFFQMQDACYITRTWGDCYGYLLVATGRADVMIDPMMSIWDAAALQPIMEEAGGTFTDWQGVATIEAGEGIGTNGLLLKEVLAITSRFPRLTPS
jgi:histidinol-phosphatase